MILTTPCPHCFPWDDCSHCGNTRALRVDVHCPRCCGGMIPFEHTGGIGTRCLLCGHHSVLHYVSSRKEISDDVMACLRNALGEVVRRHFEGREDTGRRRE